MKRFLHRWVVRQFVGVLAVMLAHAWAFASAAGAITTATVVLLGEKPRTQRAGQPALPVDVEQILLQTLPAVKSLSMLVEKESAAATLKRAPQAAKFTPHAVVIFTGSSDSAGSGEDEELRATLVGLIRSFTKNGTEVFVVPSATFVGADVCAVLRMAAEDAAVHYIEPGAEIMGDPYTPVIKEIGRLLAPRTEVSPTPSQLSVALVTPMPGPANTSTTTVVSVAQTPATIYMVPPPALKRFDPRETPKARRRLGKLKSPEFED